MKFFTIDCVFYRAGDWDDLQIDPHVSLHDGFKIQFAGIVPVFLEFIGVNRAVNITNLRALGNIVSRVDKRRNNVSKTQIQAGKPNIILYSLRNIFFFPFSGNRFCARNVFPLVGKRHGETTKISNVSATILPRFLRVLKFVFQL